MMRNIILSLLAVLLVMYTTPPAKQIKVNEHPQNVKKQSIIQPLQPTVHAQKQEVAKVPVAPPKPAPVAPTSVTGTCGDWLAQAGISDPDAVWLIGKESGCRPTAQNPTSTAYGIFQFLDSTWASVGCVKTPDPVEQMRCGTKYVMQRYGSWAGARSFWQRNHWY